MVRNNRKMHLITLLVIIQILVQQPLASYGQQSNWKTRQQNYVSLGGHSRTLQDRMTKNADALIKYYAVDMEDMNNFNKHLNKILIPRVPGTKGSQLVREHIKKIYGRPWLECSNSEFYRQK